MVSNLEQGLLLAFSLLTIIIVCVGSIYIADAREAERQEQLKINVGRRASDNNTDKERGGKQEEQRLRDERDGLRFT